MFNFLKSVFSKKQAPQPLSERALRGEYRKARAIKLYNSGLTPTEISREIGVARSTVYWYLGGMINVHTRPNPAS